jgi:omega-amidase
MSTHTAAFRFAGCQMRVSADRATNRARAAALVAEAAAQGAQVIALPECWNCPYSNAAFPEYAECCPSVGDHRAAGEGAADAAQTVGESALLLASLAKCHSVYLIGGSIPERTTDARIYNTCLMYGPDGELLAKHRKVGQVGARYHVREQEVSRCERR